MPELAPGAGIPSNTVWQAMEGSQPVAVVQGRHGRALRLPCHFSGTPIERASWDRPVQLDLSACRGLRFDVYCADPASVSAFVLYLHSRSGWYTGSFHPGRKGEWSRVVVAKSGMRTEEQPAGWSQIDGLRISAWRGGNANTAFYIANLALDGADAPIAVIRGDSACTPGNDEAQAVAAFTAAMSAKLDALGMSHAVIGDGDVTAGRLKGKRVAILPYNPGMPAAAVRELSAYLAAGGRLLAFYILPPELAEAGGIGVGAHLREAQPGQFASIRATDGGLNGQPAQAGQASWNIHRSTAVAGRSRVAAAWFNARGEPAGEPAIVASSNCVFMNHVLLDDDPANKRALLLAMLGSLDEGLWKKAAADGRDRAGRFGPYAGMPEALRGIRHDARGNERARRMAEEASALYGRALQLERDGKFPASMRAAEQARGQAIAAHCAAQRPLQGESRAWWCHSAFGVAGLSWDEAVGTLAANGFTAVMPNMLWGGVAFYNSTVLPVAPAVKEQGDQIAACVAACRKHGVQCHVWKVNWNMGHPTAQEFVDRMVAAGRTQIGFDGAAEPRWLCPSHPDNQKLEIDAMVEVATKYDVDGIHFDYIRYPDADHCFCAGCRERFEAVLGAKVAHWPADTRREPAVRRAWLDFRCDNITKVVAAVHHAVKQQKPHVQISAAVFPNWTVDRDGVGQDWRLWCERGYLDFVCPMDYTPDPGEFASLVGRQLQWAGRVPCRPGIGLSTWEGETDVPRLIEMVRTTRKLRTGGFTIFNYGPNEAARVVPLCGQGLTRPAAVAPAGFSLTATARAGDGPDAVSGYIRDLPPESAAAKEMRRREVAARRAGILVIMHRGAADFAPENTLEAYAAAMDRGADGCEIDIRRSRDGVLYLHHDGELGRVFQGKGPVNGLTYFELLQCPLAQVHGTADKETRIPTLAALLALARQRGMLLHLDIKEPGLEDAIAALLDASDTWDHVVHINAYNSETLRANPRLKLLAYKGWDHEAGQTAAAQKAFMAKPAPMVIADGDPAKALKLIGRATAARPIPLPGGLRHPWTKDRPAAGA